MTRVSVVRKHVLLLEICMMVPYLLYFHQIKPVFIVSKVNVLNPEFTKTAMNTFVRLDCQKMSVVLTENNVPIRVLVQIVSQSKIFVTMA